MSEKPMDMKPCPFCKATLERWGGYYACPNKACSFPLGIAPVESVPAPVGLEADALALAKLIYIGMDSGAEWKKEAHRRAVALSNLIENSRSRAPVEPVPAPVGLDLEDAEKVLASEKLSGRGFQAAINLVNEVRRLRASLSPRPATGADQGPSRADLLSALHIAQSALSAVEGVLSLANPGADQGGAANA